MEMSSCSSQFLVYLITSMLLGKYISTLLFSLFICLKDGNLPCVTFKLVLFFLYDDIGLKW